MQDSNLNYHPPLLILWKKRKKKRRRETYKYKMRKWIVFKKEKGLLHKLFSPLKAVKVNESYVKKMECFTQKKKKKNRDVNILNKYCYNFFIIF